MSLKKLKWRVSHKEINSVIFKQGYLDQNTFHFLINHGAKAGRGKNLYWFEIAHSWNCCFPLPSEGSKVHTIKCILLKLTLKMHAVSSHLLNNWLITAALLLLETFFIFICPLHFWSLVGFGHCTLTEFLKD